MVGAVFALRLPRRLPRAFGSCADDSSFPAASSFDQASAVGRARAASSASRYAFRATSSRLISFPIPSPPRP